MKFIMKDRKSTGLPVYRIPVKRRFLWQSVHMGLAALIALTLLMRNSWLCMALPLTVLMRTTVGTVTLELISDIEDYNEPIPEEERQVEAKAISREEELYEKISECAGK